MVWLSQGMVWLYISFVQLAIHWNAHTSWGLEGDDKGKDGEKYSANQVAVEFIDWHALEGLDSSEVGRC